MVPWQIQSRPSQAPDGLSILPAEPIKMSTMLNQSAANLRSCLPFESLMSALWNYARRFWVTIRSEHCGRAPERHYRLFDIGSVYGDHIFCNVREARTRDKRFNGEFKADLSGGKVGQGSSDSIKSWNHSSLFQEPTNCEWRRRSARCDCCRLNSEELAWQGPVFFQKPSLHSLMSSPLRKLRVIYDSVASDEYAIFSDFIGLNIQKEEWDNNSCAGTAQQPYEISSINSILRKPNEVR